MEFIPPRIVQQIDSYELVEDDEAIDRLFRNGTPSGKFTIKSALKIARGELDLGATENWNYVWKLPVSQRIRFFLWLVLHDRLMTNANRFIRKLTDDPRCLVCGEVEGCPTATMVWRKFPGINDHEIFRKPLAGWIAQNTGEDQTRDDQWPTVFCTTLWWLWKWRNNRVFASQAEIPVDQLGFIMVKV